MDIKDPAFNYDQYGHTYSGVRRPDPTIAAAIDKALGSAGTVLNVGAGAGSYEPEHRYVVAVEPSSVMRAQREKNGKAPALIARADALPFDDHAFDASMTILSVHHWPDMNKGLNELRRVTKQQVIVMTFDPEALNDFWNVHYFPELIEIERRRYPTIEFLVAALGGHCEVIPVAIPLQCTDGFQEAFYGRPEAFLQKNVRQSQSAWGFLSSDLEEQYVEKLRQELSSGEWDRKYGHLRTQPVFPGGLRLVAGWPNP